MSTNQAAMSAHVPAGMMDNIAKMVRNVYFFLFLRVVYGSYRCDCTPTRIYRKVL